MSVPTPRSSFGPVVAAILVALAACTAEPPTGPEVDARLHVGEDPDNPLSRVVAVCNKSGPAGAGPFRFQVSATGGSLLLGRTFEVGVGECAFVWEADAPDEPESLVTVRAVGLPPGVRVGSVEVALDDPWQPRSVGARQATIPADWFHAGRIDFHNVEGPAAHGPCGECEGKVTSLTLRNDGPSAQVEVTDKKGRHVLFSGVVPLGGTFTFEGKKKHGEMGKEVRIRVDGQPHAVIHTSCSRPVGPGLRAGDFTVVAGTSRKGGALCPVDTPEECDFCKYKDKPQALTFTYTGESCAATDHSQKDKKVRCSGDPAFAGPVRIVASGKKDPFKHDLEKEVYFDGVVELGGTFRVDARNAVEEKKKKKKKKKDRQKEKEKLEKKRMKAKLKSKTHVFILDMDGNVLQTLELHTSCSQPLFAGDQFGSLVLDEFVPRGG